MYLYLIIGLLIMGVVGVVFALAIGLKPYTEPHDMWPFRDRRS
jgi:hypothetical protein